MEMDTTTVGTATVVACDGRLNLVSAPGLSSLLDERTDGGDVRVVIDLTAVSFVDSSGIGALIRSRKRARQAGGDLRIAVASEQVRAVLMLTNLDRVLPPYPTVAEALDGW